MKKIFQAITFLLLIGCVQQPQLTLQEKCQNIGYEPGTDQFRQCVMTMYQENQANLRAAAGFLAAHPMQTYQALPQNRPIQTNCTQMGDSINCNSQNTGIDTSMYNTR